MFETECSDYGLRFIKSIKPTSTRYNMAECLDKNGNRVFIKAFRKDCTEQTPDGHWNGFVRCIILPKILGAEFSPEIIDFGIFPGKRKAYFVMPFLNLCRADTPADLDMVIQLLRKLHEYRHPQHHIDQECKRHGAPLDIGNGHKYLCDVHGSLSDNKGLGNAGLPRRHQKQYIGIVKDCASALDQVEKVLVHRDTGLGNVPITDGRVYLLDFEHSRYDIPLLDLVHLARNLYCNEKLILCEHVQAKIHELYGSQRDFQQLYNVAVVEKSLGYLNHAYWRKDTWDRDYEKKIRRAWNFMKEHVKGYKIKIPIR